jgi:Mrp family chromosome partitioning ATPase
MKIMSLNMLMESETDPVIWRGPVIAGIVKQFWSDVNWGDVDFMFVDMPPGTGDVPLTVFQSLPVDGIIVVATPQELVGMIVDKAINMARMMNVPVLGIVENMSYMECPHCGEPIYIFGESKLDAYAASRGLDVLGRIPMNPEFATKCDAGKAEDIDVDCLDSLVYVLDEMIK